MWLLFVCIVGCSEKSEPTISQTCCLKDSVTFVGEKELKYIKPYHWHQEFLLSVINGQLIEYTIRGEIVNRVRLPNFASKILDFCPLSRDSIFLLTDANCILLTNIEGGLQKTWFLGELKGKYIGAHSTEFPFVVENGMAYFYQFPDITTDTKENLDLYFNTNRETIYSLSMDSVVSNDFGGYPPELKINDRYVAWPNRIFGHDNYLVYSFQHSDSIIVVDQTKGLSKSYRVSSNYFHENSLFDIKKVYDYNYINRYDAENSRFGTMVYDKFRRQYYRVLQHAISYYNTDNTNNRSIDKPFSILVFDESFQKTKEVIFPPKKCDFRRIVPTPEGVLIGDYSSFVENKDSEKSMKYIYFSTLLALISCSSKNETEIFSDKFKTFLSSKFNHDLPLNRQVYFVAPASSCGGCLRKLLDKFSEHQSSKDFFLVIDKEKVKMLRDVKGNILIDDKNSIERAGLNISSATLIVSEGKTVQKIFSVTPLNADSLDYYIQF